MRKILFHLLGIIICLTTACLLPIIPIQRSAAIPHPVYSLAFVSIAGFMNPFRLGVWYQAQWYTFVSALALLIISGVIGIRIGRTLMKKTSPTQD
jgi:hypothetical protein